MTGTVSLRGRLTLWFTMLLAAMGLIGGIAAYLITRHDPDRFVDDQLRQIAFQIGDPTGTAAPPARAGLDPSIPKGFFPQQDNGLIVCTTEAAPDISLCRDGRAPNTRSPG